VQQTRELLNSFKIEKARTGQWSGKAQFYFEHRELAKRVKLALQPEHKVPIKDLLQDLQNLLRHPEWITDLCDPTLLKAATCLNPKVGTSPLRVKAGIDLIAILDYHLLSPEQQFLFAALTQAPSSWPLPRLIISSNGGYWLGAHMQWQPRLESVALPKAVQPHPELRALLNQFEKADSICDERQAEQDIRSRPATDQDAFTLTLLNAAQTAAEWRKILTRPIQAALEKNRRVTVLHTEESVKTALTEAFPDWAPEAQRANAAIEAHLRFWCGISGPQGGHPLANLLPRDERGYHFDEAWNLRRSREESQEYSLFLNDEETFLRQESTGALLKAAGLPAPPFDLPEEPYRALGVMISRRLSAQVNVLPAEQMTELCDDVFFILRGEPVSKALVQGLNHSLHHFHLIHLRDPCASSQH